MNPSLETVKWQQDCRDESGGARAGVWEQHREGNSAGAASGGRQCGRAVVQEHHDATQAVELWQ